MNIDIKELMIVLDDAEDNAIELFNLTHCQKDYEKSRWYEDNIKKVQSVIKEINKELTPDE